MATTKARTKQDVDQMTADERLWDSLSYGYDKKAEKSGQAYDKEISAQDRATTGRGMQRSSYAAQSTANMRKQKLDAADDIESQKIADYEDRLRQAERDAVADEQWERTFGENQRQFNENLGYQRERAAAQDTQWERSFGENQRQFNENMGYQRERAAAQDTQWERTFGENQRQFNENLGLSREQFEESKRQYEQNFGLQKEQFTESQRQFNENMGLQREQFAENQRQFNENLGFQKSEAEREQRNTEWNQNFQQSEAERSQKNTEWEQNFKTSEAEREQKNTEWTQNFQKEQFETQKEQWREEFGYQQKSDTQKFAAEYVMQIIQNGGDPSDELLAQAGLSRADANAMKVQAASGGRGGYTKKKTDEEATPTDNTTITDVINTLSDTIRQGKDVNNSYAELKKNLVQQRKTMDRL